MGGRTLKVIGSPRSTPEPLVQAPARPMRVALINMPWVRTYAPSIQCGLLKAVLEKQEHEVDVFYLNLKLASLLGPATYATVSELESERVHLLGEWLFGTAAFGPQNDEQAYIESYPEMEIISEEIGGFEGLCKLRNEVLPGWIQTQVRNLDWSVYDVIGFTSTFEQNVPAIALARGIKESSPDTPIVFGGANFEGEMGEEFVRAIQWIDYGVTGEGDLALPAIVSALSLGEDPLYIPGVCGVRDGVLRPAREPARTADMSSLPAPNYDDYFAALDAVGAAVLGDRQVRLVVEFSRGCWWGEKHHCTFCGLNALGMAFRAKPGRQAMAEVLDVAGRFRVLRIDAVDNIMDMKYLTDLCLELRDAELDLDIFFEVKANLSRNQVATLRDAGIRRIQPGLESLNTHILELMRKGSSLLINVRLLKWAHYYDMAVIWNILMGFPGETDDDYRQQVDLIPSLYHLTPPGGCGRIWLERFSPFYSDPELGFTDKRPKAAYRFAYPVDGLDHTKIAYFFEYAADQLADSAQHAELADAVRQWQERWTREPPELVYRRGPGYLDIHDSRDGQPRTATLSGWRAAAYRECDDSARTPSRVSENLASQGYEITQEEVRRFLDTCVDAKIAVTENGRYLALALPERR